MSAPAPQVSQPISHWQNNELVNYSWSYLTPTALEKKYFEHLQTEITFLLDIDDNDIQSSVLQYQSPIDCIVEGLKCICRCYGFFISAQESQLIARNYLFICNAIISRLLVISNVDSCSISTDDTRLCTTCCRSLLHGNKPKFRILNVLSHIECQSYPLVLANLSMAKEAAIARTYLVMSILKLRPSRAFNLAAYTHIKGHAVLLPPNPAPLLNLLLSPTLVLHDVIRII